MKIKIALAVLALSMTTWARALDKIGNAQKVKTYLEKTIFEIKGVNGIGIGGCNPRTGQQDVDHNFVYCVVVYAETKQALKTLKGLYPMGTQIRGVFIAIEYMGKIVPEPRMSAGG